MKQEIIINLEKYTTEIKEKEKQIVLNFVDIGKRLKEVRDKKIYKEKYSEFGEYVNSSGFNFSESHAYRMIQISTEISRIDATKYGITKCIELLKLPVPERKQLMEEKNVEGMSVRELKEEVEEKKEEIALDEPGDQRTNQGTLVSDEEPLKVADRVDMLDKALSYLSEELDNVFIGLDHLQKPTYKKEYSENKKYFTSTFKRIDSRLSEVTNKLRKAKVLLKKLKQYRRE